MEFMATHYEDIYPHRQAKRISVPSAVRPTCGKVARMLDAILERIDIRLAALRLTPERASKLAGLSRDAIRKMHSQRDDGMRSSIRVSTLTALAPILGVTPEWLTYGVESTAAAGLAGAPLNARLQAGVWTEHREALKSDATIYVPADLVPRGASIYAAEISGESMNRIFPNGTVVVLERRFDDLVSLVPNRRYHVERIRADGAVESTLKTVRRRADGSVWLVPESDDPEFQTAIPLKGAPGETINIAGRVICAVVPG
jgi:SOS-response transcriptional repressor LexA